MSEFTRALQTRQRETFETFRMRRSFRTRGTFYVSARAVPIADAIRRTLACREPRRDLRTPRRRFCPCRCGERRGARRRGAVRGAEGVTRFALPERRGRVFGRDTKVRAPRIPWLRLPGWANSCVSPRRDSVAKSRAIFTKSRGEVYARSEE